jgi:hypothetical protein
MEDTGKVPETAPIKPLEAPSTPAPSAPVQDASAAEVERLRKEAEQAKMRANQLENELKAKRDAEEAQRQKQLEEQEQYKALWEQSQEQLRTLASEKERQEAEAQIKAEQASIYSNYPQRVLDIADTTGLKLSGTDESAKKDFVSKLDKIKESIGEGSSVRPNNGNPNSPAPDRSALIEQARTTGDRQAIDQAIGTLGFIQAWKQN